MSIETFELQDKYQVVLEDGYKMTINRNNEDWMSSDELAGNNIMLALIQEVLDLREQIDIIYEAVDVDGPVDLDEIIEAYKENL